VANATLNHVPLPLSPDGMQSPSLASATEQRPAVALLSYPALPFPNSQLIAAGIAQRGRSAAPAQSSSSPSPFDPHLRPRTVRSMACWGDDVR
jgi:hypothetical protein